MAASIEPVGDGCSGFQWLEWAYPIRGCCDVHDLGGSDGVLLDCLMANTPEWTWPVVALCVAVMILFRPIYRLFKPKGTAQH